MVLGNDDAINLSIADDETIYATATATRPSIGATQVLWPVPPPNSHPKSPSRPDALLELCFDPLTFEFHASRDLAFATGLSGGAVWRDRGWAHPTWVASGTNALVHRNIDFGTPGSWTNAGIAIQQLAPITDGATITLAGRIDEVFDRGRHRFAVAAIIAWADGKPAASFRNTFVYHTHDGHLG